MNKELTSKLDTVLQGIIDKIKNGTANEIIKDIYKEDSIKEISEIIDLHKKLNNNTYNETLFNKELDSISTDYDIEKHEDLVLCYERLIKEYNLRIGEEKNKLIESLNKDLTQDNLLIKKEGNEYTLIYGKTSLAKTESHNSINITGVIEGNSNDLLKTIRTVGASQLVPQIKNHTEKLDRERKSNVGKFGPSK
jgi:hypothetical protein